MHYTKKYYLANNSSTVSIVRIPTHSQDKVCRQGISFIRQTHVLEIVHKVLGQTLQVVWGTLKIFISVI